MLHRGRQCVLAAACRCTDGYSTSRTCEIGLSKHSRVPFQSIVYLVDEATKPKSAPLHEAAAPAHAAYATGRVSVG